MLNGNIMTLHLINSIPLNCVLFIVFLATREAGRNPSIITVEEDLGNAGADKAGEALGKPKETSVRPKAYERKRYIQTNIHTHTHTQ